MTHNFIWLTVNDARVSAAYVTGVLLAFIIGGVVEIHWRWQYKKWPFGKQ